STPYGFPPYLPSQRFDFQRYREAPEDAVTSSSEFHDAEPTTSEDYFGRSRDGERADPCPAFDPISAFYAPKTDGFEATSSDTQKTGQKTLTIDSLLSRSDTCSLPDVK
ncbi:uncharacterized protein, partial [Epargyreus clarus]|uniref:uncharacterized protein n=1 Tax=Epargyreus clarus TaxID=520877 RepID=UPI003C2D87CE